MSSRSAACTRYSSIVRWNFSFPAAFGIALAAAVTLGSGLWLLWHIAHRRDQTERIRRWSISVTKPQALQRPHPTSRNGQNGDGAPLYRNVQNLD